MTNISTSTATFRKSHKESPLGLFIAVINERPAASEREHKKALRHLLLSPGYEDFLDGVIREWQSIKYSAAYRAANPPTVKEVTMRAKEKQKAQKRDAQTTESAKMLLGGRLLDLITPNGKLLRDCTGAECRKFGGFYARISKKVSPGQKVGNALSAEGIVGLWKAK